MITADLENVLKECASSAALQILSEVLLFRNKQGKTAVKHSGKDDFHGTVGESNAGLVAHTG